MQANVLNVTVYNWPMREHIQRFVMGPYKYMHLLQRLGPCCFFQGIQLYCTWVLPSTMTMYATWARSSTSKHCFHSDMGAYRNPNCHPLSIKPGCDSANEMDLWSQGSKLMDRLDLALQVGKDVYCVSDNMMGVTDGVGWSHTHVISTDLSLAHL
jgi:hypothetical protein